MANANLKVLISANTRNFMGNMTKAQKMMVGFGTIAAAGVLLAGKAMLSGTLAAAKFGDEIDKLSRRTGLSTRDVQELQVAAELGGATMMNVEKAVGKLAVNMFDLQNGSKTAKDMFDALGLSMEDLADKSVADRLTTVLGRLDDLQDKGRKSAVALKILGKSGAALIPLAEELEAARKAARGKIVILTDKQIKDAAKFTDQMALLTAQIKTLGASVGSDFMKDGSEALENFSNILVQLRKDGVFEFAIDSIKQMVKFSVQLAKVLDKLTGIKMARDLFGAAAGSVAFATTLASGAQSIGEKGGAVVDLIQKELLEFARRTADSNEKIAKGDIG